MAFTLVIDPRAMKDVQDAIDYYEDQQSGLGVRFENALNEHLLKLEKSPFFRIRYDNVRCLLVKKFPYMLHFSVNEDQQLVYIWAVLHTAQDPEMWKERK